MRFWLDGDFHADPNCLSISDRGFLLGDGVFETMLVKEGTPAFLAWHLERLRKGLKALSISDAGAMDVVPIIRELAHSNELALPANEYDDGFPVQHVSSLLRQHCRHHGE